MNTNTMQSTSSSPYQDNIGVVNGLVNALQTVPGMLPQNLWQTMLPQNTVPNGQQQQPQVPQVPNFSYPQIQNQTLPTGMIPAMQQDANLTTAFNNAVAQALLPAQFLQDAARLSAPVGSSINDDELLAKALHDTKKNGLTYRRAIEGLHGVNNHAANLWKDYYLDHKSRIDRLVSSLGDAPPDSVKLSVRPPFATSKIAESRQRDAAATLSKRRNSAPKAKVPQKGGTTQRKTFNSITAPSPAYDSTMPAPNAEVQVPDPPSRSPTPPNRIVPGRNGNRYTDEDKEYFVKFISWRLKWDPSLTKAELCEMLAEKAPHHTHMSWASHWHGRHDIADKILAAAHAQLESTDNGSDLDAEGSVDDDDVVVVAVEKHRTTNARKKKDRKYSYNSESSSGSESSSSSYQGSDDNDPAESTKEDEQRMARSEEPFSPTDIRNIARYIANSKNWDEIADINRWSSFSNVFPQRSHKSWAEGYRKHKKLIQRLVRRYQKQKRKKTSALQSQRALPSWAKKESGQKRKLAFDGDMEREPRHRKRVREEEDSESSSSESDSDDDYNG